MPKKSFKQKQLQEKILKLINSRFVGKTFSAYDLMKIMFPKSKHMMQKWERNYIYVSANLRQFVKDGKLSVKTDETNYRLVFPKKVYEVI